jgi:hypothetical protein
MRDIIQNWDRMKAKMQRMKQETPNPSPPKIREDGVSSYTPIHEKYYWKHRDEILRKAREKHAKRRNKYS